MQFSGSKLSISSLADGIHVLDFNSGGSVNKFDAPTLAEFETITTLLAEASEVTGLLVESSLETFIVGADIFEFVPLFAEPVERIEAFIEQQSQRFIKFASLPFPTLALVNGVALGGGFEMALACDERIGSPNAQLGLPETTLGIIPGFGGCVRLSRLIEPLKAMEWIVTARPRSSAEALVDGALNEIAAPDVLRAAGTTRLARLISTGSWRECRAKRQYLSKISTDSLAKLRKSLQARSKLEPAPLVAVDVINQSQGMSELQACALESKAFAAVSKTQAANALVSVFVNDQTVRKKAKALAKGVGKIGRIGVVGAGIMGTGIAETAATNGIEVGIFDTQPKTLERTVRQIDSNLQRQVTQGRMSAAQAQERLSRVKVCGSVDELKTSDWVIEAVSEQITVKESVFKLLNQTVASESLVASNTSSLSISALATMTAHPARFVGIHFFNPVPKMPLVEIIPGQQTSDAVVAQAVALALQLKKVPIVVGECAGFLVNRVLMAYVAGFEAALAAGLSVTDIDHAMVEFGWPMGPGMLMDVIGLDTMVAIAQVIGAGVRECLHLPINSVILSLVQQGYLGQKSGAGFYRHQRDDQGRWVSEPNPTLPVLHASSLSENTQLIQDRLMLPMVFEAKRCLDEKIGASAAEIDMAMLMGLGFPRAKGGPLCYASWRGAKDLADSAVRISTQNPLYAVV